MKYKNTAEILPSELLREIQGYIEGEPKNLTYPAVP